jgi:hypothetical protein
MVQNFYNFQACTITLMLKNVVRHFQECKEGLHWLMGLPCESRWKMNANYTNFFFLSPKPLQPTTK